jgi:hypothetical protein|tara:strand:+ start:171 stop:515 length:345 start_codon:yes stop_codon:yes gene_type:complete
MAITHTQSVTRLTIVNNSDNIVSEVEVKTVSVDDSDPTNLTIEGDDTIGITTEGITPSTAGFVAYDSLTQDTILNWTEVKNALDSSNTKINQESWINSVKTPPTPTHVDKALPF